MTLSLGASAPQFRLAGVDGREHALDDYADAPLFALVQSCNHCPYVLAWEDRLIAIVHDYAGQGLIVAAVCSNDADAYPEDSFEAMQRHAAEKDFPFDYLHDPDQSVARALESERTPEVFLFDSERRLRYHGAIDDSRDDQAVTATYFRDAVEALLAEGEPPVADTAPVGCTVKWK